MNMKALLLAVGTSDNSFSFKRGRETSGFKLRALVIMLAVALSFLLSATSAYAATVGGNCGPEDNPSAVTWTFDTETGALAINGTGPMASWDTVATNRAPWYDYREAIAHRSIGEGVTTVGDYSLHFLSAEANKSQLVSISLPSSLTEIGVGSFAGNTKLVSIAIPNDVRSIGQNAFSSCSALASVELSENLESIGVNAFSSTSIVSIVIPEGVTSISSAFRSCRSLASVVLPSTLATLENYAFSGCSSLTSLEIVEGVQGIGNYAFENCTNLEQISIPSSVTSIGNNAFMACTKLGPIYVPNVATMGYSVFSGCKGPLHFPIDEPAQGSYPTGWSSVWASGYTGEVYYKDIASGTCGATGNESGVIWVLDSKYTLTIAGIGPMANYTAAAHAPWYGYRTQITKVIINEGVTSIGDYAFRSAGIISLVIPSSVNSIGKYAAYETTNLESLVIREGAEGVARTIGESAFEGCKKLASVIIPEGVSAIGIYAFYGDAALASIVIPPGAAIGEAAFQNCTQLHSLVISEGVTSIGNSAFQNTAITSVAIPGSVEAISQKAFSRCPNLVAVTIGEGVRRIGNDAFASSTVSSSLTTVKLPSTLTAIGNQAF
ncbi:MAG: leucine-rich repeat domain-containing protein, partial [Coriobacteriales bacterium]|nr:leucine-rich repeat domain-containing protein [Coriobacteriales bacterium]